MIDRARVIEQIRKAFAAVPHPGDAFLQGSFEGSEPYEAIAPFKGVRRWEEVDVAVLDANAAALSFLSEGGFRFFLPAYLIADLEGRLQKADPLFHIAHGFHDSSIDLPTARRTFTKALGKYAFVNPRRYGAMRWYDHARCRLSVFAREEARAIVVYLEYQRASDPEGISRQEIDAALQSFWLDRATNAPEQRTLDQWVQDEADYAQDVQDAKRRGQ